MPFETATVSMLSDRGVFAALQEAGNLYAVMTIQRGLVDLGDEVRGELKRSSPVELLNVTRKQTISVIIDDYDCGKVRALDLVRSIKSPGRVSYLKGHP